MRMLALGGLRASHTRAWKVWLAGQKSDNASWFPSTVYKTTKEAMSVFLGFLEATVRKEVTSAGIASCERLASTECMTAGLEAAGPPWPHGLLVTCLPFSFSLPFFFSLHPSFFPSFLSCFLAFSLSDVDDPGPGRTFWNLPHALPWSVELHPGGPSKLLVEPAGRFPCSGWFTSFVFRLTERNCTTGGWGKSLEPNRNYCLVTLESFLNSLILLYLINTMKKECKTKNPYKN